MKVENDLLRVGAVGPGQHVAVEAGHSDTDDSTVLHAPSIGLVAAGDVVYNNVHQYLAETGGGGMAPVGEGRGERVGVRHSAAMLGCVLRLSQ